MGGCAIRDCKNSAEKGGIIRLELFPKIYWWLKSSFAIVAQKPASEIIIFSTGIYTGVYIAQNYEIDKVEDPKILYEKATEFVKSKLAEINKDDPKKCK